MNEDTRARLDDTLSKVRQEATVFNNPQKTNAERDTAFREAVRQLMSGILNEFTELSKQNGAYNSAHEGWAYITKELDELWDEVRINCPERALHEAIQVAASAMKFILDLQPKVSDAADGKTST